MTPRSQRKHCPGDFEPSWDNAFTVGSWFWPLKWRYFHCHCHDFRFYVTLFPKCFSNFRSRYLFAIGLPTLYLTLADKYLPTWHCTPKQCYSLSTLHEALRFTAHWANTFFGSILTWRVVFSNGFALRLNFAAPAPSTKWHFCHNSRPYKTRFGNEFDPSSLAAHWENHGCFLFLRWVICLSLAGSPAILRSVNKGRVTTGNTSEINVRGSPRRKK